MDLRKLDRTLADVENDLLRYRMSCIEAGALVIESGGEVGDYDEADGGCGDYDHDDDDDDDDDEEDDD